MNEPATLRQHGQKVCVPAARRLPGHGDPARIASKNLDVIVDPAQRLEKISGRQRKFAIFSSAKMAQCSQAIVDGDHDDPTGS